MLSSARRSLQPSFRNVLVVPGSRVFFLASDGPLFSGHLRAPRDAPDQNPAGQPALPRRHADPRPDGGHSQRREPTGGAEQGLQPRPLLLPPPPLDESVRCPVRADADRAAGRARRFYLVRLRGSALVLFASGFAASALEIVLLLAFQVLCGSVYHQVGIIVTVFMGGVAAGAFLTNRSAERIGRMLGAPKSHLLGRRTRCFPSPRPSPLGRGRIRRQRSSNIWRARDMFEKQDAIVSLSPRERAGVRGRTCSRLQDTGILNQPQNFGFGSLSLLAFLIAAYAVLLPAHVAAAEPARRFSGVRRHSPGGHCAADSAPGGAGGGAEQAPVAPGAAATATYRLRLCPAERGAIARVVDTVFGDSSHYLLGIGPLRVVADTIIKGLPA